MHLNNMEPQTFLVDHTENVSSNEGVAAIVPRFRIVPLLDKSKKPRFSDWPNTTSYRVPTSGNHGLLMGEYDGQNLLCIDVDEYKADFDAATFDDLQLPPTLAKRTASGGRHLIYELPPGFRPTNFKALGSCVDILHNGRQIVGPGSVYGEKVYGDWNDLPIAPLPAHILDMLSTAAIPARVSVEGLSGTTGTTSEARCAWVLKNIDKAEGWLIANMPQELKMHRSGTEREEELTEVELVTDISRITQKVCTGVLKGPKRHRRPNSSAAHSQCRDEQTLRLAAALQRVHGSRVATVSYEAARDLLPDVNSRETAGKVLWGAHERGFISILKRGKAAGPVKDRRRTTLRVNVRALRQVLRQYAQAAYATRALAWTKKQAAYVHGLVGGSCEQPSSTRSRSVEARESAYRGADLIRGPDEPAACYRAGPSQPCEAERRARVIPQEDDVRCQALLCGGAQPETESERVLQAFWRGKPLEAGYELDTRMNAPPQPPIRGNLSCFERWRAAHGGNGYERPSSEAPRPTLNPAQRYVMTDDEQAAWDMLNGGHAGRRAPVYDGALSRPARDEDALLGFDPWSEDISWEQRKAGYRERFKGAALERAQPLF